MSQLLVITLVVAALLWSFLILAATSIVLICVWLYRRFAYGKASAFKSQFEQRTKSTQTRKGSHRE